MSTPVHAKKFCTVLSKWYLKAQRPLPWRKQPSLYRTVVSEFMAQQTQIKTMLPYFTAWMKSFPDFKSLAKASDAEVLKHWEGLGYYTRARNLHRLAKTYVGLKSKPKSQNEWQKLPGIGPYTSAAISSIEFGQAVAVVDGNVVRVLARLSNNRYEFKNNAEAVKTFTAMAETLLNPKNPGEHNQAMMELGATICKKAKPLCSICPITKFCTSYELKTQKTCPNIGRKATKRMEIDRAWILQEKRLLLHLIPDSSTQLAGQYELPKLQMLADKVLNKHLLSSKTRKITNRYIKENIYECTSNETNVESLEWIPLFELESITLSGPHRRWVRALLDAKK